MTTFMVDWIYWVLVNGEISVRVVMPRGLRYDGYDHIVVEVAPHLRMDIKAFDGFGVGVVEEFACGYFPVAVGIGCSLHGKILAWDKNHSCNGSISCSKLKSSIIVLLYHLP